MSFRHALSILFVAACAMASHADARQASARAEPGAECRRMIGTLPVMHDPILRQLIVGQAVKESGGPRVMVQRIHTLADAGDADALYALGVLEDEESCGDGDEARAMEYFDAAARRGSMEARVRLGMLAGACPRALELLEGAADQGSAEAQQALVDKFQGECADAPEARVRALAWYLIWASRALREVVADDVDDLSVGMSELDVAAARKRAGDWLAAHPTAGRSRP